MPQKSRSPKRPAQRAVASELADSAGEPYSFKARFGALIAATGVAGVPRALCHYLGELSLSYTDLGFITHILSYRWTSAYPFPSQRKLAAQAGIGRTGIQRRICALQDLGYLEVAERYDEQNGRRTSNGYNLTPLLERLNELILRDWDTLWKHRDPLVSNGEDDETTPPRPVDSSPPGPQKSAGASRQKWAGGRSQKWVGPGRRMSVGPAPRSAPEVEAPNSDAARMESQSIEDEPVEEKHHRATTTPHVSPLVLIERAIAADSDELGDQRHLAANRTRARRLWSQTDLPADEFVRILGEARARTLEHAERVISQERTGVHLAPMLMPYYFGVVKGILRERGLVVDDRPTQRNGGTSPIDLEKLRVALGRRVRSDLANRWLAGARIVSWDPEPGRCVLGIRDPEGVRKLSAECRPLFQRAVAEVAGREVRIEITWLDDARERE